MVGQRHDLVAHQQTQRCRKKAIQVELEKKEFGNTDQTNITPLAVSAQLLLQDTENWPDTLKAMEIKFEPRKNATLAKMKTRIQPSNQKFPLKSIRKRLKKFTSMPLQKRKSVLSEPETKLAPTFKTIPESHETSRKFGSAITVKLCSDRQLSTEITCSNERGPRLYLAQRHSDPQNDMSKPSVFIKRVVKKLKPIKKVRFDV